MLTVKLFTLYKEDNSVSALVSSYGREYAANTLEDGSLSIHRTNGRPGYERLPKWKAEADIKAITLFIETEMTRNGLAA